MIIHVFSHLTYTIQSMASGCYIYYGDTPDYAEIDLFTFFVRKI